MDEKYIGKFEKKYNTEFDKMPTVLTAEVQGLW